MEFGRWRADDVRSILAAAGAAPQPRPAGQALVLTLPSVPTRPLSDYAFGGRTVMSTAPPPLAADLNDGLRRLKMAAMRRLAPELLVTAKTQRWNPEEFLRTLVEAEITARDESNARTRMRAAAFPVAQNGWRSSTSPPPRSRRRPSTTSPASSGSAARRTPA